MIRSALENHVAEFFYKAIYGANEYTRILWQFYLPL